LQKLKWALTCMTSSMPSVPHAVNHHLHFAPVGDAHYIYRNAPSFTKHGELCVHNRKELVAWLDKIIEDTQKAHNFHLVSDDEDVLSASVATGSPITLPIFITFR
jgi:hypothetical protein